MNLLYMEGIGRAVPMIFDLKNTMITTVKNSKHSKHSKHSKNSKHSKHSIVNTNKPKLNYIKKTI